MIIKELNLIGFGKFKDKKISFKDGLNIVYGNNESGKTTIHRFIDGMFYGFLKPYVRTTRYLDEHEKYEPWNNDRYFGTMKLSFQDMDYRIERNFKKSDESTKVLVENTGEDITNNIDIGRGRVLQAGLHFFAFNEIVYSNTISIKQLGAETDKDLAKEVREKLINMTSSLDEDISIEDAIEYLDKNIRDIGSNRAPTSDFAKLYNRNIEIENEKSNILRLKTEYDLLLQEDSLLEEKLSQLRQSLKNKEKELEIARYRHKEKLYNKASEINKELKDLKTIIDREEEFVAEHISPGNINRNYQYNKENPVFADYLLYDEIEDELNEYRYSRDTSNLEFLKRDKERLEVSNRRLRSGIILFSLIYIIGAIILARNNQWNFFIMIQLLLVPTVLLISRQKQEKKNLLNIQKKIYNLECEEKDKENQIANLESQLKDILAKHELTNKWELKSMYEAEKSNRESRLKEYELSLRRKAIYDEANSEYKNKLNLLNHILEDRSLENLEEELINLKPDELLDIHLSKEELELEIDKISEQINDLTLEKKTIEEGLNYLSPEISKLVEIDEEINRNKIQLEEWTHKKESLELAKSTILSLSKNIHNEFAPSINRKVGNIIKEVTDGKYDQLRINNQLDINLLEPESGQIISVDSLSGGTIDQLYFSLRFGVADSITENKLPLLLDDSFTQYDEIRLKRILELLVDTSKDRQIILFTCQRREVDTLKKITEEFNLIDLNDTD